MCPDKPPFTTIRSLKRHKATHDEKKCLCSSCSKCFATGEQLGRHVKDVHSAANAKKQCDVCGVTLKSISALYAHLKRHRLIVCSICCKTFSSSKQLALHKKEHKTFECEKCEATFTRAHDLKRHELTIHQQGNFCILCESYTREDTKTHLAKKHAEVYCKVNQNKRRSSRVSHGVNSVL
jgi:uncharacterized Zn-finger protein